MVKATAFDAVIDGSNPSRAVMSQGGGVAPRLVHTQETRVRIPSLQAIVRVGIPGLCSVNRHSIIAVIPLTAIIIFGMGGGTGE